MQRKKKGPSGGIAFAVMFAAAIAVIAASAAWQTALVNADMTGENGKAIPSARFNIPVRHSIAGDEYKGNDSFEFILAAADDNCPMPEGSENRIKRVTVRGDEDPDFGDIVFEYPDAYYYSVSRCGSDYDNLEQDTEMYKLMIIKFNDRTVQMVAWNSSGEKVSEITYIDEYTAPRNSSPKTGDDNSRAAIIAWAGVLSLSLAALITAVFLRCRRKEMADEE